MRNKRLDFLRFMAVALVLSAHTGFPSFASPFGWSGVDLFFVLSGFLISGLLYTEYKKIHAIDFKRFFIRRGLKIYPAFYALILVTFVAHEVGWVGIPTGVSHYLREIAFVQNYGPGLWDHTWSLAVEEHFYIGLALLLMLMVRFSTRGESPFRRVPVICFGLAVACMALRALTLKLYPNLNWRYPHAVYAMTHTRMDSLFFGVFLGYLYHFRSDVIRSAMGSRMHRAILAIVSASLIVLCFSFRGLYSQLTFGLTCIYLGFGGLLVLCLESPNPLGGKAAEFARWLGSGGAYIGRHSYSIYLWHLPFLAFAPFVLRKIHLRLPEPVLGAFYFFGACALGIVLAHAIEFPVLKLRDQFFPARETVSKQTASTRGEPSQPSNSQDVAANAVPAIERPQFGPET